MTKNQILRSIVIAFVLSLPAIWLFSFAPSFFDPLYVATIPLEELRGMSEAEVRKAMNKAGGYRHISGVEKTLYLLQASPSTYIARLVILFGFLFLAALLGSRLSERSRNET